MSLNINKAQQSGFTIVELLIVVVVIAILAAITIVSYNGITNQAKASAAQATASTLIKKAELYASENAYPTSLAALTGATADKSWNIPSGTVSVVTAITASTKEKEVVVQTCGTAGVKVWYKDFQSSTATAAKSLTAGNTADCTGTDTTPPTTGTWTAS